MPVHVRPRWIVDDHGMLARYKRCTTCHRWRPLAECFYPRTIRRPDGTATTSWESRCKDCDRERCLANQARWRADRERRQRILDAQRMNYRLRAKRAGREIKPLTEAQYRKRYGSSSTRRYKMPAEVLAAVAALIDHEVDKGVELEEIASRAGLPSRRLWAVRNGEGGSLYAVERLCIALGVHLSEVEA